jgi:hypothetical protein
MMLKYIEGQTAVEMLGCWTKEDLYDFAKELNIKNRSKMNKAQLAMALEDAMADLEQDQPKTEQGEKEMIFLIGFDFDAMAAHAAAVGGYFEKGIYADRVLGVKADSKDEAVKIFLEKRKNWIRDEEKKYVEVLAACDQETWENEFYSNEAAWMRYMERSAAK